MTQASNAPQPEKILRDGQIVERIVLTGVVNWFDDARGWGFITRDDGETPDVHVHYSNVKGMGQKHRQLFPGQKVSFEVIDRGRGPAALNCRVIEGKR